MAMKLNANGLRLQVNAVSTQDIVDKYKEGFEGKG